MLLWALRAFAIVMGAAHAAISIHDHMMNEDGISYLDLGDRYARGDWLPLSSVWSPLFPLLLGLAIRVAQPTPRWEFAVAHLVTFAIYVGALAAFEFFWRTLWRAMNRDSSDHPATITFAPLAWWLSGYMLFVWSAVVLVRFRAVTPDMLVAGMVYLAAGLLVRTASTAPSRGTYALLGVALGIGYLAKTVMFPMAFAFLAAAAALAWRSPERRRALLMAVVGFVAVAAPLVVALSVAKRGLTFGEAGAFTYLKHVNGLEFPYDVTAIPSDLGVPVHPIRRVHQNPAVYEFATPIPGTYPPGYDPSYWVEGLEPRFDAVKQMRDVARNTSAYGELFLHQLGGPLALTVLLLWMGREQLPRIWPMAWPLALIGIAGIGLALYALIYVEGRYTAPFVILFCGGGLSLVRLTDSAPARRALTAVGVLLPALVLVELVLFDAAALRRFGTPSRLALQLRLGADRPDAPWRIARAMHEFGIRPGERVGFIGYAFGATFARLARVQIVAEMPWSEAGKFWRLDAEARALLLKSFADAGAVAVISEVRPPPSAAQGWTELVGSGRYAIAVLGGAHVVEPQNDTASASESDPERGRSTWSASR